MRPRLPFGSGSHIFETLFPCLRIHMPFPAFLDVLLLTQGALYITHSFSLFSDFAYNTIRDTTSKAEFTFLKMQLGILQALVPQFEVNALTFFHDLDRCFVGLLSPFARFTQVGYVVWNRTCDFQGENTVFLG